MGRRRRGEPCSSACTKRGLFEGRVPHRRPLHALPPAGSAIATASSSTKHDAVLLLAAAVGLRPAPVRRRQPPRHLPQARRAPVGARRTRRHALRGVGAECRARERRRAVQPLGRAQARDADARPLGHLGAVRPGPRAGHGVQVRDPHARAVGRCSSPIPTASRCSCVPTTARSSRRSTATTWQDGAWMRSSPPREPPDAADQHLRGASRLLAPALRPLCRHSTTGTSSPTS